MAYQNVSTPRIYLNIPEYLASTGGAIDNVFRTLPVSVSEHTTITVPSVAAVTLTNPYIAILGHSVTIISLAGANVLYGGIINGGYGTIIEAGFSIAELDDMPTEISFISGSAGSILLGTYFDFPHSPDLSLSLSYDYSGIKEITTKGGNTLSNKLYSAPPKCGSLGAWELGGDSAKAKSGRRIWDLSFSFLSDSSVFPDNAGLVNLTSTTDTTGSGSADLTLLADDTIQRVIHLTQGSHLPFLFQSDNSVAKPDSFAICKFDMKEFKFEQVANGVYNMKLKIREVW